MSNVEIRGRACVIAMTSLVKYCGLLTVRLEDAVMDPLEHEKPAAGHHLQKNMYIFS